MSSDRPAVLVRDLRARFGAVQALLGLSFEVNWGDRLAILGPNGAGKTTLLRVLAGALQPSSGQLIIGGLDPTRQAAAVRPLLGVLAHQTYLYGELTVLENLRLYGRLYGVRPLDERGEAIIERVGLGSRRFDRVDSLSRGLQQRLAIGRAILHRPPILLLDEPDTGLDLAAAELLRNILLDADWRPTVLMATHNLDQAQRLCERAIVLAEGRLAGELPSTEVDAVSIGRLRRQPANIGA